MSNFPHICPRCGSNAYVGLNNVECTSKRCANYLPGSDDSNPDAGILYRDFCMSCHEVAEFDREDNGKYYLADCPHCGCLNSWAYGEADWDDEDEDTQPQWSLFTGPLPDPTIDTKK